MCYVIRTVLKLHVLYYYLLLTTEATRRSRVTRDRVDKQNLRVINGEPDTNNDFPFAVGLELHPVKPKKPPVTPRVCTGSLIASTWVLTAAHCTAVPYNMVRFGALNASGSEEDTFRRVLKRITHPDFKREVNLRVRLTDIALTLITPAPINIPFAKLSAVDYQSLIGMPMKLAGYGMEKFYNAKLNKPLQVAEGVVIKCDQHFGVSGSKICLASKCGRPQKMYRGDSGGPLLVGGKLVGVASSTIMRDVAVGFYWPISPYLQWIQDTVRNNQVPVTPKT